MLCDNVLLNDLFNDASFNLLTQPFSLHSVKTIRGNKLLIIHWQDSYLCMLHLYLTVNYKRDIHSDYPENVFFLIFKKTSIAYQMV